MAPATALTTPCSTRPAPPCCLPTPPVEAEVARTHSGLITAFSLHLVKPGVIAVDHGRALNKVEDLRLIADYKGDQVTLENARWAIEQAGNFVAAIVAAFPRED